MKEAAVIEQQKKRDYIQMEKQKKKKLLLEDMENINLHSRAMAKATLLRSAKCDALTDLILKGEVRSKMFLSKIRSARLRSSKHCVLINIAFVDYEHMIVKKTFDSTSPLQTDTKRTTESGLLVII